MMTLPYNSTDGFLLTRTIKPINPRTAKLPIVTVLLNEH